MSFASALIQPGQWPYIAPIILLFCSNLFMTLAWYGHLKFKAVSLVVVVLVSWGIAFVEYCFAVPANRIGSAVYSPAELKTIQEIITLIVFAGFTTIYFDEPLSWTQAGGFAEGVGADQWDWDESADDGEYGQNHRNDKNCGGRRRQIHLQPSLLLTREI
jgi:uncharacterized protein (DUF486 family)